MEELKRIKNYVDQCAGYDISTKSRKADTVLYRALYFKLAIDNTNKTLSSIGQVVKRDHATVLHARNKLFDYLMSMPNYSKLYDIYKIDYLGQKITEQYQNIKQYNKLKEKYNNLLVAKIPTNLGFLLTDNEISYRKLDQEEKQVYDQRANLVLKSFEWKRKDEQRKEVYDIIVGEPTVENTRGVLR